MQIQLEQADLEAAVRNYVSIMGISRPVGDITFTSKLNPSRIITEIEMQNEGHDAVNVTPKPLAKAHAVPAKEPVAVTVLKPTEVTEEAEVIPAEASTNKSLFAGK